MPLINGQKMACEPCIRGHRSTKCTHANERLMVPVRKPGRPLSSCPHPSSRSCSCAAVTAAIPRKQKCRCGTAQAATGDKGTQDKELDLTPPSPSKATTAPGFRVQKQGTKSSPGRRQSIDPNGLGRMNSNQLNIFTQYKPSVSFPDGQAPPVSDMPIYGPVQLTPAECSFGSGSTLFTPVFQYPLQSPTVVVASVKSGINGCASGGANGPLTSSATPALGSCCGDSTTAAAVQVQTSSQVAQSSSAAGNGSRVGNSKGCCSTTGGAQGAKLQTSLLPQTSNGGVLSYQAPMTVPNGVYPYYSQPSTFNYPPQFGSFLQPLQPEQWRQFMATVNYGQVASGYAMNGTASPPQSTGSDAQGGIGISWTSHQCNCGDSCQCVGCAAHPYNDATQDYVRSAWNTMMQDGRKLSNGTHATSHVNGHGNVADGSVKDSSIMSTRTASEAVISPMDGTVSPPAPQTPSDGTSGMNEEQTLSANDFFFVSYPFGETCAGEMASCPCGDDCQCIGCVIHHNPAPEQGNMNGNSS